MKYAGQVTYEPSNGLAYHTVLCSSVIEHQSSETKGLGFDP